MNRLLMVGATSAIAEHVARDFARQGATLFLVGRNVERLEAIAADLRTRGASAVTPHVMDANDLEAHLPMIAAAQEAMGGIDAVLIAHGTLSDQKACETSVEAMLREVRTNALSTIALLTPLANLMEAQGHGTLAVISSVAGERGRQSNYVYGSSKAMVTAFCSGLRQRLAKSGVRVVTIKPGFVDTPMTRDFAKKGPLWAKPEAVGAQIAKAMRAGRDTAYTPFFWAVIMQVIRAIPEGVFKRLSL